MDSATVSHDAATTSRTGSKPVKLLRRIGSTTYEVTVRFSDHSTETMADIVRRILEREAESDGKP